MPGSRSRSRDRPAARRVRRCGGRTRRPSGWRAAATATREASVTGGSRRCRVRTAIMPSPPGRRPRRPGHGQVELLLREPAGPDRARLVARRGRGRARCRRSSLICPSADADPGRFSHGRQHLGPAALDGVEGHGHAGPEAAGRRLRPAATPRAAPSCPVTKTPAAAGRRLAAGDGGRSPWWWTGAAGGAGDVVVDEAGAGGGRARCRAGRSPWSSGVARRRWSSSTRRPSPGRSPPRSRPSPPEPGPGPGRAGSPPPTLEARLRRS